MRLKKRPPTPSSTVSGYIVGADITVSGLLRCAYINFTGCVFTGEGRAAMTHCTFDDCDFTRLSNLRLTDLSACHFNDCRLPSMEQLRSEPPPDASWVTMEDRKGRRTDLEGRPVE